jgi:quinol monooxygenase YgiN
VLVINRYRVPSDQLEPFLTEAAAALEVLAARPGFVSGRLGRSTDEPGLHAMVTDWADVGSYRRALSHPLVKVSAHPLMYRCIDEPGAYEVALETVAGEVVRRSSDLSGEIRDDR